MPVYHGDALTTAETAYLPRSPVRHKETGIHGVILWQTTTGRYRVRFGNGDRTVRVDDISLAGHLRIAADNVVALPRADTSPSEMDAPA